MTDNSVLFRMTLGCVHDIGVILIAVILYLFMADMNGVRTLQSRKVYICHSEFWTSIKGFTGLS